ncbi:MAG: hypothetical protein WA110_08895 [Anaerolineaceae bacterium]
MNQIVHKYVHCNWHIMYHEASMNHFIVTAKDEAGRIVQREGGPDAAPVIVQVYSDILEVMEEIGPQLCKENKVKSDKVDTKCHLILTVKIEY